MNCINIPLTLNSYIFNKCVQKSFFIIKSFIVNEYLIQSEKTLYNKMFFGINLIYAFGEGLVHTQNLSKVY